MVAVVMAGGFSKRMGNNKALIQEGNQNWLEKRIELLEDLGLDTYISCRRDQAKDYENFGKLVFDRDSESGKGVYSGMISCLLELNDDCLFIPVDMNRIDASTIKTLLTDKMPSRARCFVDNKERIYPFPLILRMNNLNDLLEFEKSSERLGQYLKQDFVEHLPISHTDVLFNCNSPKDIEQNA